MRFESYVVTELFQHLERQGAALRPRTEAIAVALASDEYQGARAASAELQRALDTLVANAEMLGNHVVVRDGLGALGASLVELTLRARCLVLGAQLGHVHTSLRAPAIQARARGWFVGKFRNIEDVVAFVRDRLIDIHALWRPYRQAQPRPSGLTDVERANMYRTTVRVALRELCALREDPDLARFLAAGLAAPELTEVHEACQQLAAALAAPVDLEPEPPAAFHPRQATNGAGGRR
jgi:hypothetical protein